MKTLDVARKRRDKSRDKAYLFTASREVWEDIEDLTKSLDMSVAYFLRESVRRNIALYRKAQVL